jgi:hypothetical protein
MLSLNTRSGLNPLWCVATDSPLNFSIFMGGTDMGIWSFNRASGGQGTDRHMMTPAFNRLSMPVILTFLSLTGGVIGGTTAVHGLAPNSYGPSAPTLIHHTPSDANSYGYDSESEPTQVATYEDCQGCSERDRGYHWASLQRIGSIADCPMDSWDFQRGCVAYMRDAGGV